MGGWCFLEILFGGSFKFIYSDFIVILDLLYLVGDKADQPLLMERFRSDQLRQGSWQGNDKIPAFPRKVTSMAFLSEIWE